MGPIDKTGRAAGPPAERQGDMPGRLGDTTDPAQKVGRGGDLFVSVETEPQSASCSELPFSAVSKSYQARDIFIPDEALNICAPCTPNLQEPQISANDVFVGNRISMHTDPATGVIQINMPDYLLEEINKFAAKEGIAAHKLPDLLFKIIQGNVFNPDTGKLMSVDEIRKWGYQKLFEGDVLAKVEKRIAEDPKLQRWYQENKPKIIDNFTNNFKAHGGMYMFSIFALMGMSELADVAGIEDPTVRLAFILGPLKPITRVSGYVYESIKGRVSVKINGYRSFSMFKPRVWATPISKVEIPSISDTKVVKGKAVPVRHNLVSISFHLEGAGAKQFFKGLVNSIFPPGETALIRAGKTLVGTIKFPVHLFNEFANLGCGVVAQTVWTQTLGRLIPGDFLFGVPKHFFEIFTLLSPYMAERVVASNLRPQVSRFVHHPAFKVFGTGLALDLSALASVWLSNLFNDESTIYLLSTYFRSAENSIPFLKYIPTWVPFRTYLSTFIGTLNKMELKKVEQLDKFLSATAKQSIGQSIKEVIEPDLTGKKWLDFAKDGGFQGVGIDFLHRVGTAKKRIDNFDEFLTQLRLLVSLRGMPENRVFDECFEKDWINDLEKDEISEVAKTSKYDDEALLKKECAKRFLVWLYMGGQSAECIDGTELCYDSLARGIEKKALSSIRQKFAAYWIERDFDLLASLYYSDFTGARLKGAHEHLKALEIDPHDRKSPYWGYAELGLQTMDSEFGSQSFDPSLVDKIAVYMAARTSKLEENRNALAQELCTYVLWLESHAEKVKKGVSKKFSALKDVQGVLSYISPSKFTEKKALQWWQQSPIYSTAIVDYVSKRTEKGTMPPGVIAYAEEQLELVTEALQTNKPIEKYIGSSRNYVGRI